MVPNMTRATDAKSAIQLSAPRQKITRATVSHTTVETKAIESKQMA